MFVLLSQGASQSDQEADSDPDGVFAFRRKAGCCYHSVWSKLQSMWFKK